MIAITNGLAVFNFCLQIKLSTLYRVISKSVKLRSIGVQPRSNDVDNHVVLPLKLTRIHKLHPRSSVIDMVNSVQTGLHS